jgi:hypothetical protein
MKKLILLIVSFLDIIISGCSGNQQKGTIQFIPLSEKDFNAPADTSFIPPESKEFNERRRWHDSCMGTSFHANAFFIRTRDTFHLGDVVNRKTMKLVKRPARPDSNYVPSAMELNVLTKPCYYKMRFNISIDTFFKTHIILKLQKADDNLTKELNDAIHSSTYTEVEEGSWIYLELTDALGKMLDTTKNSRALEYKAALLQPDNMVLIRSAAMTDVSFYVHPLKPISEKLKAVLLQKPVANIERINLQPQLFFIDETTIELNFKGYFQLVGQFMKCELRKL